VGSDVDVQICLNIVAHLTRTLELLASSTHAVRQGLVARWHPTSLHTRSLLLVPFLFFVLAEESGNGLDGLLRVDLFEISSGMSSLHELGNSSRPQGLVLP
jgi:hypothetical protein